MKKLGELLKQEREKKGLSLHEIGMSLKINPKILQAIEAADESKLPAKTFLRGFVRSYAQFLKLNVEDILKLFNEETGVVVPPAADLSQNAQGVADASSLSTNAPKNNVTTETQVAANPAFNKGETPKPLGDPALAPQPTSNRNIAVVVGAILVVMIVFVAKLVEKYQRERVIVDTTTTVVPAVGNMTTTTLNSTESTGTTTQAATPATNFTTTTVALATSTTMASNFSVSHPQSPASSPLSAGQKVIVLKPVASPTPNPTPNPPTTTITMTKPSATLPAKAVATTTTLATGTNSQNSSVNPSASPSPTPKKKSTEVIIEALNNVHVSYLINGKKEELDLASDQIHTFKSTGGLDLEISDGGAVNIIVNGKEQGVPGRIGSPIKLSYPK